MDCRFLSPLVQPCTIEAVDLDALCLAPTGLPAPSPEGSPGRPGCLGGPGATGPTGPAGDDSPINGAVGATGPTGPAAVSGGAGPMGATGPSGASGTSSAGACIGPCTSCFYMSGGGIAPGRHCIVLPIEVYCTGGYTTNSPFVDARDHANGYPPAVYPNTRGCTPVSRGTIDATSGAGSSVDVNGAAFVTGTPYSSVEAQAVDGSGKLVYAGNAFLSAGPAPAKITVTYNDCMDWISSGSAFPNTPPWCDNQMALP